MYNILWDFDETLGYREGGWYDTLYSLLKKNEIEESFGDKIKLFLSRKTNGGVTGFTWPNYEKTHEELFMGKTWYEYYENYFYGLFERGGIKEETSKKLSKEMIKEYMDETKWFVYDDVKDILDLFDNLIKT